MGGVWIFSGTAYFREHSGLLHLLFTVSYSPALRAPTQDFARSRPLVTACTVRRHHTRAYCSLQREGNQMLGGKHSQYSYFISKQSNLWQASTTEAREGGRLQCFSIPISIACEQALFWGLAHKQQSHKSALSWLRCSWERPQKRACSQLQSPKLLLFSTLTKPQTCSNRLMIHQCSR